MPFTAAHAMAVLPLVRWRQRLGLDTTCLVIGAMAPDFEYFVRARPIATISHTLHGLWQWNLPVTLLLAALFHGLVKWPALLVAPAAITRRAITLVGGPWRARWGVAAAASCAASAVLGAASHLVWDSVTHADGWMPRHVYALRAPIRLPLIGATVLHRLLQHASTLVGLIALGIVVVCQLRRAAPRTLPDLPRTAARLGFAACTSAGAALILVWISATPAVEIGDVVVGAITGVLAGTLLASAILYRAGRRLARLTACGRTRSGRSAARASAG